MSSIATSPTVEEVNLAFLKVLGLTTEDEIESVTIYLKARELPTMVVTRYIGITHETVERVSRLRLREVTGDGM